MTLVGLTEAAAALGVTPRRVRQLVDAGTLKAVRVGSRWLVDDANVEAARTRWPLRPLSERSAWALIMTSLLETSTVESSAKAAVAQAQGRRVAQIPLDDSWHRWWAELKHAERARARHRWNVLCSEAAVSDRPLLPLVRGWLAARAERVVLRAMSPDVKDLAADDRLTAAGVSLPDSGISSGGLVEAYVRGRDLNAVRQDYFLRQAVRTSDHSGSAPNNVVLHVLTEHSPGGEPPAAPLLLAADLADWQSTREDGRAREILHAALTSGEDHHHSGDAASPAAQAARRTTMDRDDQ